MAIRYKNPQTGEYEVIKIPVMKGDQGHAGIHVGTDAPPTTDVKLWFDPSDTDNDVDLANRLDTTLTACYDYMGNDRGSIKAAADANVDWLLGEINTAHYEGQHITATDTIEGRSKSAILKGQTLVNNLVKCTDIPITNSTHSGHINFSKNIEVGKEYTIIISISNAVASTDSKIINIRGNNVDGTYKSIYDGVFKVTNGIQKVKFTSTDNFKTCLISFASTTPENSSMIIDYLMFIEGDYTNIDVPYFTGMQSVQMPGLTTTGKNLCNRIRGYHSNTGGTQSSWASFDMSCKPNTTYTAKIFSGSNNRFGFFSGVGVVGSTDSYKITVGDYKPYTGGEKTFTITTGNNDNVMWIYLDNNSISSLDDVVVQVEEGSVATSYEPYQSNILTVNEPVELRGIGEVRDTLDCLTGEVVQSIGNIVLNGSEDWSAGDRDANSIPFFQLDVKGRKGNDKIICDKLIVRKDISGDKIAISTTVFGIMGTASNAIRIKNGLTSLTEFKQWLSQNPVTVQYQLATPVIETVDLSDHHVYSYKDVTHYTCSSEEGSLIPTLSIDVPTNLSALVTKQRSQIETLKEENKGLNQELQLAITSSEENDNELLAQSFELDFRLMEVECALDLPMAATFRLGGKAMAMTPYEMAKKLILAGNYDRADMEHKLDVYVSKKRMTEAERQELIQLMDEKEGVITVDPIEPEIEESDVEHEAVTIPLH